MHPLFIPDSEGPAVGEAMTAFLSPCSLSSSSLPARLQASNAPGRERGRVSFAEACMTLSGHVNIHKTPEKINSREEKFQELSLGEQVVLQWKEGGGGIKIRAQRPTRRFEAVG